ncbi:hypothetical protein [Sphingomonas parapaucimobilis]|uniref:hypothetical protein n=1 Tax=Sphingomonas parapaucimobilis TaxID=28213 RepID=UPI00391A0435
MRRYNIADLTDDDLRRLRMLVRMERATAHIVVRTDYAWPIPIQTRPRQWQEPAIGDAIN